VPQRTLPFCLLWRCWGSAAYANHFGNSFHSTIFTPSRTTLDPQSGKRPTFFVDAATVSTLPANRVYRPLLTTSLASTTGWRRSAAALLSSLHVLFWFPAADRADVLPVPTVVSTACAGPPHRYVALFGAACTGFIRPNAETVNYIVQRADLYSTLGCGRTVAYAAAAASAANTACISYPWPGVAGQAARAGVFPRSCSPTSFCSRRTAGAILVGAAWKASIRPCGDRRALLALQGAMTPRTWIGGASSALAYNHQPFIALRYFGEFFLPLWLSADTDRQPFSSPWGTGRACSASLRHQPWWWRRPADAPRETRPIAFGLSGSCSRCCQVAVPLAEVRARHRMFFPFVGWP